MDGNNLEELRELIEFLRANDIAEFDMERPDWKVRLKFGAASYGIDVASLSRLMATAPPAVAAAAWQPPTPQPAPPVESLVASAKEILHQVKSPIVGTFYESPSPGSPAFVKAGDMVEVGQVLCIIEAMKLMNEIESDVAGEVVSRIAESGQPVEYGQALFSIRAV